MPLRIRLLILVLIAAVPVLGLQVHSLLEQRAERVAETTRSNQATARLLAGRVGLFVETARAIAETAAHFPEVRRRQPEACSETLRALLARFPNVRGIGAVDPAGNTFCRTTGTGHIYIGDRPYFQAAVRDKQFTASRLVIGRAARAPGIVFAAPALGDDGAVEAVVVVAVALSELSHILVQSGLPSASMVRLFDEGGELLAGVPDEVAAAGPALAAALRQGNAQTLHTGSAGVETLDAVAPVPAPGGFTIVVSTALGAVLSGIEAAFWRDLAVLAAIFSAAGLAAWFEGERVIRRPINRLRDLAGRLAGGDLSARAEVGRRPPREIASLAASLNAMAAALQGQRDELRDSERRIAGIADNLPGVVYRRVLRPDGRFEYQFISGGVRSLYGRSPEEFLALQSTDDFTRMVPPEDREVFRSAIARAAETLAPFDAQGRLLLPDGEVRWVRSMATTRREDDGTIVWDGVALDITEMKQLEERQQLLMAELDHRVKNILAVVRALARRSQQGGEPFAGRLAALAHTHSLLAENRWVGADLRAVVQAALAPYEPRVAIHGSALRLPAKAAQGLGLAMHEMATNAAKYGALSVPEGKVDVNWTVREADRGRRLEIEWQERGGPSVAPPTQEGFGTKYIRRTLSYDLGGEAQFTFASEGLRASLHLPLPSQSETAVPLDPRQNAMTTKPTRPATGASDSDLAGRRVLLVDDEAMVAMVLETVLVQQGVEVLGPAGRLDQALALAASAATIDAAVLDVNLAGTAVWPLAEELRRRGVPMLLVTGYDRRVLPPGWRDTPCLSKPVDEGEFVAALTDLLRSPNLSAVTIRDSRAQR